MDETYDLIAGFLLILLALSIPILILCIIANWKLLEKAGEEGWKSLIPYYCHVVYCKCFMGKAELSIIPIATSFLAFVCSKIDLFGIAALMYLASFIFSIFQHIDIAKSFGKSSGFAVGLIFLSPIFLMILAFGGDQYYGPKGVSDYTQDNFYNNGYSPYIGANGYQNNGYNSNYQNNGYQNNGYNSNYQNNGYQNNSYNNNYQNNGYQNNSYNNNYQNSGFQNNSYNNNSQNNEYQNNRFNNQNASYNNPNANTYQNPVNNYAGSSYQNPSNNNGVMDDIDTSKIDVNNSDFK